MAVPANPAKPIKASDIKPAAISAMAVPLKGAGTSALPCHLSPQRDRRQYIFRLV